MSHTNMEITRTVERLIRKNVAKARDRKRFMDHWDLRADLEAHDLDILQLVMDIEDEFTLDITDEEAEGLKCVGDCILIACAKVAAQEEAAA